MHRGAKIIWIGGAVMLLLVLLVAVLASSQVQTRIVRQVLADQPGMQSSLGSVKLGWGGVTVSDLVVKQGPLSIRIPALQAELPVWRLLTDDKRVDRLVARGWEVRWDGAVIELADARPVRVDGAGWSNVLASLEGAGATDSATWWQQLTRILNRPLPFTWGEVDLEGRTIWRQAGPGADGFADVVVSGSGPRAGTAQRLRVDIAATGARASARGIQSLAINNELETILAEDRTINRLKLETELVASLDGPTENRVYGLSLDLSQAAGTPRLGLMLREGDLPLISAHLESEDASSRLHGDWAVALNATNLRHLMLGRELPGFALDGHGDLSANVTLSDLAVTGTMTFLVNDLGTHYAPLSGVGDLSGETNFAIQQSGHNTRFTRLDLALAGAAPVLEARLLQGVEIGRDAFALRVANPDEPLGEIKLEGLPPAWVQPWLAPWVLDARPVEGKLLGLVSPQGLRVITSQPIRMDRVALAQADRTWVDDGTVEVDLGVEITPLGWQVELGRMEIARHGRPVVTLQARGGQLQQDEDIIKVVGRVEVDLVGLTEWPGFEERVGLDSGRLTAEFGVGLDERVSIATAITMDELTGREGVALPNVEMDGRLDLRADGGIEVHLPARIHRAGRSSELTLNLRTETVAGESTFESSLSSPVLHLQDVQDFAAIFPSESPTLAGRVSGDGLSRVQVLPAVPVWGSVKGSLQVSVGELRLPEAPAIERVRAAILVHQEGIEVESLEAVVGAEGRVISTGRLEFDSLAPLVYRGSAELTLSDVAVEPWLRWFDPEQLPVLTGRVNLSATWSGVAREPLELVNKGVLQAQVSSSGGVIRALGVEVDSYIQTGQTVAALGSLFGALTGNEKLTQQAQRVQSASRAAAQLSAITFDQLNLGVDRVANGDVIISDLALISPALRLIGDGRITYRPGVAFWLQPLELTLNLSARDELGTALTQMGLLGEQADALGYLPLVSNFTLDGSLANIGTGELQRLLMRSFR